MDNEATPGVEYYVEWERRDEAYHANPDGSVEVGSQGIATNPDDAIERSWPHVVDLLVNEYGEPEPNRADWRVAVVYPWDSEDPYDPRCSHRITVTDEAIHALDTIRFGGSYEAAIANDGRRYITLDNDVYTAVVQYQRDHGLATISDAIVAACRDGGF
jgi:hypothetical protein